MSASLDSNGEKLRFWTLPGGLRGRVAHLFVYSGKSTIWRGRAWQQEMPAADKGSRHVRLRCEIYTTCHFKIVDDILTCPQITNPEVGSSGPTGREDSPAETDSQPLEPVQSPKKSDPKVRKGTSICMRTSSSPAYPQEGLVETFSDLLHSCVSLSHLHNCIVSWHR